MEDQQDISQRTVIVLVVLTVIISAFGTLAVLSEVNTIGTVSVREPGTSTADVQLTILDPNKIQKEEPSMALATGKVSLNILSPE